MNISSQYKGRKVTKIFYNINQHSIWINDLKRNSGDCRMVFFFVYLALESNARQWLLTAHRRL